MGNKHAVARAEEKAENMFSQLCAESTKLCTDMNYIKERVRVSLDINTEELRTLVNTVAQLKYELRDMRALPIGPPPQTSSHTQTGHTLPKQPKTPAFPRGTALSRSWTNLAPTNPRRNTILDSDGYVMPDEGHTQPSRGRQQQSPQHMYLHQLHEQKF